MSTTHDSSTESTEHRGEVRSRRALLFGALGGLGAWVAAAAGRANPVQAGVDGDVVLAAVNTTSEPTTIRAGTTDDDPFVTFIAPYAGGGSTPPYAVYAHTGTNDFIDQAAIRAETAHGYAVWVRAGFEGRGVTILAPQGQALGTTGHVRFHGHNGVGIIPAGRTSVVVRPEYGVNQESWAVVTPMVDIGSRRFWYKKDSKADTLTLYISSPRTTPTRLSWIMFD
jgi:hypothetical protein